MASAFKMSPSVCLRMVCAAAPGLSLYSVELQCAAGAGGGALKKGKGERAQRSALLFTHRGYSGPAVLDLSHRVAMAQERGTPAPGAPPASARVSTAVLDLSHRVAMAQERGTPAPGAPPVSTVFTAMLDLSHRVAMAQERGTPAPGAPTISASSGFHRRAGPVALGGRGQERERHRRVPFNPPRCPQCPLLSHCSSLLSHCSPALSTNLACNGSGEGTDRCRGMRRQVWQRALYV